MKDGLKCCCPSLGEATKHKVSETSVKDCTVIEMDRHLDHRGFFQELFNAKKYSHTEWRQINWSNSIKGVLRGLHLAPYSKLVTCVRGAIFDVVVDMRPDSPSYLKWMGKKLGADNPTQIFVPAHCAHGFLALEDCSVIYLQSQTWGGPNTEFEIRYNDPCLNILWPVGDYILSDKDANAMSVKDFTAHQQAVKDFTAHQQAAKNFLEFCSKISHDYSI